ncbi:MAG TPA: multicopper oxidase domain-containing protein [Gemmatimonadales bacterium]|nr:multicopper oxidase domain-containing protein [Gemmatimonadales bacterium]
MLKSLKLTIAAVGILAVGTTTLFSTSTSRTRHVERVDFGVTKTAVTPVYDAAVRPASRAAVKEFRIPMTHDTVEISKGVRYVGRTFGGTVPGPVIRVRQGDLVRINLVNEAVDVPHSIDFHASKIPMDHAMKSIAPGDSLSFEFEATTAGVFMVHCGTPPVLMHIAQGMYLPIIVDPRDGWPTKADKEFVLVQSDFYPKGSVMDSTIREGDWAAMQEATPKYVVFNGRAFQYKDAPLQVDEGDVVRLFVMNAGPNIRSDFHVVGTIFDRVYPGGNVDQVIEGVQTYMVPTGGGAVFEMEFAKGYSGTGNYAFVTQAFADANKGAVGVIRVGTPAHMASH